MRTLGHCCKISSLQNCEDLTLVVHKLLSSWHFVIIMRVYITSSLRYIIIETKFVLLKMRSLKLKHWYSPLSDHSLWATDQIFSLFNNPSEKTSFYFGYDREYNYKSIQWENWVGIKMNLRYDSSHINSCQNGFWQEAHMRLWLLIELHFFVS